jgi:hypothetical protein
VLPELKTNEKSVTQVWVTYGPLKVMNVSFIFNLLDCQCILHQAAPKAKFWPKMTLFFAISSFTNFSVGRHDLQVT